MIQRYGSRIELKQMRQPKNGMEKTTFEQCLSKANVSVQFLAPSIPFDMHYIRENDIIHKTHTHTEYAMHLECALVSFLDFRSLFMTYVIGHYRCKVSH